MVVLPQHIVEETVMDGCLSGRARAELFVFWKIRAACTMDVHGSAATAHCR